MKEDVKKSDAAAEPDSILPDGIGLTFKDVQELLATKHETAVPKDDPMLMFVTIINACLAEMEKLHVRHEAGMGKLLADKTDGYVAGVRAATNKLTDTFSSAASEGVRNAWAENMSRLAAFRANLNWCGTVIFLSALVNVAVFILMGLR